ncbi:MAG: hypothetical protein C0462_12215 [Alcanivorax sp.]|nr:hypothetical protein [Alcanivorax sp.]
MCCSASLRKPHHGSGSGDCLSAVAENDVGDWRKSTLKAVRSGINAFSRYERGEARPVAAVINLFRMLDKHPELLSEVREPTPL